MPPAIRSRKRTVIRRVLPAVVGVLAVVASLGVVQPAASGASNSGYQAALLVSDRAADHAGLTDPTLVNPWGISFGPSTPLWVVKNGSDSTTIYTGQNASTAALTIHLIAAPTGTVFNPTGDFKLPHTSTPARFLFDSLSGAISGWAPPAMGSPPATTDTVVVRPSRHREFTGLAISADAPGGPRLYAADADSGRVIMYNGRFHRIGSFRDHRLPHYMVPYNVQVVGKVLVVTWARPEGMEEGLTGAVDYYSLGGRFLLRLATGEPLDGPWGVAQAPSSWGQFAGDLLIGNEDGGEINAFNPLTGHFDGTVSDAKGQPIAYDGLWGLAFGNGVIGTPNTLIAVAGPDEYTHGVVLAITPNG